MDENKNSHKKEDTYEVDESGISTSFLGKPPLAYDHGFMQPGEPDFNGGDRHPKHSGLVSLTHSFFFNVVTLCLLQLVRLRLVITFVSPRCND